MDREFRSEAGDLYGHEMGNFIPGTNHFLIWAPKNCSSWIRKNLDKYDKEDQPATVKLPLTFKHVNPEHWVIFVRHPIDRWVSGITECLYRWNTDFNGNVSQFNELAESGFNLRFKANRKMKMWEHDMTWFVKLLNTKTDECPLGTLEFDPHTTKQTNFIPRDLPNDQITYYNVSQGGLQSFVTDYELSWRVDQLVYDTAADPDKQKLKERVLQLMEVTSKLSKDDLIGRLKTYYSDDFKLFLSAKK